MRRKGLPGLTAQLKDKLIHQALERRLRQPGAGEVRAAAQLAKAMVVEDIPDAFCRFDLHPGYQQLRLINDGAARIGVANPFFKLHEGVAGATTRIAGQEYLNFASYNYLGLSGHPAVNAAAKAAIDQYGTSVSASRLVSGERGIHRQLERALAQAYGVDDAIAFVSGHATNVTVLGYLFGPKDLIIHDALIHNSALQGIQLSGARRLSVPHNDWAALDALLTDQRRHFERVLVIVEGIYSMDGDYPDLPRLVEIKNRHRVFLMVDEAHSFGVMGVSGRGLREHFGLAGGDVDIWMGTLSKAMAACGGYVAGSAALVEHLKFLAPGFLYSVGMAPPVAAAALAALECLHQEPERVARLQSRGRLFLEAAREEGIDTGLATGYAVIPAITGSSLRAARLSGAMLQQGINVQPILHPAVPEKSARLRFFVSSEHSDRQILDTVRCLAMESAKL